MAADVVDLIMQDHREVERLFGELQSHPDTRPLLLPVLARLLNAHSRAEETAVYPVARTEAEEKETIGHSQAEHLAADRILERLLACDPEDADFDSTLEELVSAVKHHVEEEEGSVLPAMRDRLDADRLTTLAQEFARSRAEHLGDEPGSITAEQRRVQAANAGIEGTSGMSKADLEAQLGQ